MDQTVWKIKDPDNLPGPQDGCEGWLSSDRLNSQTDNVHTRFDWTSDLNASE